MTSELQLLKDRIHQARQRLEQLWDNTNRTSPEVLEAADEVDLLLNEYDLLLKQRPK